MGEGVWSKDFLPIEITTKQYLGLSPALVYRAVCAVHTIPFSQRQTLACVIAERAQPELIPLRTGGCPLYAPRCCCAIPF